MHKYNNIIITVWIHYFIDLILFLLIIMKIVLINKGNNKITKLRAILQRESQNS
jgi:hypothetical protein